MPRTVTAPHAPGPSSLLRGSLIDANTDLVGLWEDNFNRRDLWFHPLPAPYVLSKADNASALSPAPNLRRGMWARGDFKPRVSVAAHTRPAHTFTDILYGGLRLEPATVDVGAVLTRQEREVELWNATFEPVTINQILANNATGIALQFDSGASFTLPPLQSVFGTVVADPSGPAEIAARFRVDAEVGVKDVYLTVLGRRSTLFTLMPSTGKEYVERLAWRTDIIESYSGAEQRISLCDHPEVEISFTVEQHSDRLHLVNSLMWGWQHKVYGIPLWHRATTLEQTVAVNSELAYTDTTYSCYRVGDVAMIWLNHDRYEAQEIAEVHSDRLVFTKPMLSQWPKGATVMPMRSARLPADVQSKWLHPDLGAFQLRFILETPEVDTAADLGSSYRGYRVFPYDHNWVEELEETSTRLVDVFESETGNKFTHDRRLTPIIVRNHALFLRTLPRIQAVRRWLYARRGSATPFWMHSGKADFKLLQRIEAGIQELVVADTGYHGVYEHRENRQDIAIFTRRGTFYRRIVSTATGEGPGEAILKLDQIMPTRIEPGEVIMVSFLSLVRLDGEVIDFLWRSDQLVTTNISTRLLSENVTGS